MKNIHFEARPLTTEQLLAHDNAMVCAKRFHIAERELLFAIMEVDRLRIFEEFGEVHLTPYCEKYLKLSADVAGTFIRVARKAQQFPLLCSALVDEKITLSKARIIAAVLNEVNCQSWVDKAAKISKNQLEREVAKANPESVTGEKVRPVGDDQFQVTFVLTNEQMEIFKRARQLLSEKMNRRLSYAEVLITLFEEFLDVHDPVRKADRAKSSKSDPSRDGSPKLSAQVRHAIHRRDRGFCQAILADGKLCNSTRWIHLHHIKPKAEGGKDTVENLTTLCSAHHRQWHERYSTARDFNTASRSSPDTGSNAKSTR
jgi:5-methylcytosine-specific restriction endonuclease McrA